MRYERDKRGGRGARSRRRSCEGAPELSSCKGADLSLDGSRSSGGGVKKLSYNWRAHPTKCDNYVAVQAALDAQGDVPTVHLDGTALDGGSAFVFLLVVSNFLGEVSEEATFEVDRAALPIPAVLIDAPPLLVVRRAAGAALRAAGSLPACLGVPQILYEWNNTAADDADGAPSALIAVGSGAPRRFGDLLVDGASLQPRVTYTLSVRGASSTAPASRARRRRRRSFCSTSRCARRLRAATAWSVKTRGWSSMRASSVDPDDPDAPLEFGWECAPYEGVGACGVAPPVADAADACAWALPPRALAPGAYAFNVLVSSAGGDAQNASVTVNVTAGLLPVVSISSLDAPKQSPDGKLPLEGVASLPADDADGAAPIALEWAIDPLPDGVVSLDSITSTGIYGARPRRRAARAARRRDVHLPIGRHVRGARGVGVVDGGDQPAAVGRRL